MPCRFALEPRPPTASHQTSKYGDVPVAGNTDTAVSQTAIDKLAYLCGGLRHLQTMWCTDRGCSIATGELSHGIHTLVQTKNPRLETVHPHCWWRHSCHGFFVRPIASIFQIQHGAVCLGKAAVDDHKSPMLGEGLVQMLGGWLCLGIANHCLSKRDRLSIKYRWEEPG